MDEGSEGLEKRHLRSRVIFFKFGYNYVISLSLFGSWWTIINHLGWTLLGVSEESDHMTSVDVPSETLARLFYATFLIFGAILLINMLIALLSNTYQRTLVRLTTATWLAQLVGRQNAEREVAGSNPDVFLFSSDELSLSSFKSNIRKLDLSSFML